MAHLRPLSLAVLLAVGCAHAPAPPALPPPPPAAAVAPPWYGDLHALAAEAAKVRGMTLTLDFQVVPLEDGPFLEAYRRTIGAAQRELLEEYERTLAAFNFEAEGNNAFESPTTRASFSEVQAEQLLAFYEFGPNRLVVRAQFPQALASASAEVRLHLLAHEVGHVLQDQLGVTDAVPRGFDAAVARRAVLEGDASLTATLLAGARKRVSPVRAVEKARLTLSVMSEEQLLELGGLSTKLLAAPAMVREVTTFPYLRGQRFMADLYRAGGLPLVEQVLLRPPTRSQAISMPQPYLDGAGATLTPLAQTEGPRSPRLGAFLMRMFFKRCLNAQAQPYVDWIDAHYDDDTFQREGEQLVWTTAWNTSGQVEQKLFSRPPGASAPASLSGRAVVEELSRCVGLKPAEVETAVRGDVVGLAAKAPPRQLRALAQTAASRRPSPPPGAPFGAQRVPPVELKVAMRSVDAGVVNPAGQWEQPVLGLRMPVPPGFKPMASPGATLFFLTPEGTLLMGLFVDEAPTQKGNDGFFNGVVLGMLKSAKVQPPEDLSLTTRRDWRPVALPWTQALDTQAAVPLGERTLALTARAIPLCDSKATFFLVGMSRAPEGPGQLRAALDTLERASPRPALCDE